LANKQHVPIISPLNSLVPKSGDSYMINCNLSSTFLLFFRKSGRRKFPNHVGRS